MKRSEIGVRIRVRLGPNAGTIVRTERTPHLGRLTRFWVRWETGLARTSEYLASEARDFERRGPAHRG